MKWLLCIIITFTAFECYTAHYEGDELKVIIEPKWQDLEIENVNTIQFREKWILIGSITFKKKTKNPLFLSKINLHWNGSPLEKLSGSLYDKPIDKDFMAIEDLLLCDGCWNKATQTLILKFNHTKALQAVNVFYIVLTVPENLESTLKNGSFDLHTTSSPNPILQPLHDTLRLSLDVLDGVTVSH